MGMIFNEFKVPIEQKEIYSGIIEYSLPDNYYFESYGFNYGNRIYGTINLSNYYTVRKREDGTIHKEL